MLKKIELVRREHFCSAHRLYLNHLSEAENKELQKGADIKRVPVKNGRWEHISYPNSQPERDGEEGGHDVLSIREAPSDRPPGDG